jgi:hypothetical protein
MDEPGSDHGERTPSMKLQPENDPAVKLSHSLDSRSAVEVDTDGRAQTVFVSVFMLYFQSVKENLLFN